MTPSPDRLEALAGSVRRELDELLEEARELYRRLQDMDAEQTDAAAEFFAPVVGARLTYERRLLEIAQQMQIAQCELVPPKDERKRAAVQVANHMRSAAA